MLVQLEAGNRRVTGLSLDTEETFDTPFTRRDNPHRAYITIIEGCDKSCAYCVVPFTRGPERSRTSESVMAEARTLADRGYTEIQLLGQNVNSYRDPSPAGWDFAALIAGIAVVPGIRRVRYTTSHPRDFVRAIVHAMDANPVLCDHVHLPVQSGSSRVLAAMDRLYTRDEYMRRIDWLKTARRSYALTTDIIVGFPGETDQDFQETLDLLDEVQYDSLFSFKYSPRPNTAALAMQNVVPEEVKQQRLVALQEKQRAIQIRRNAELIGSEQEVLVEGRHQSLGQWIGRTSTNRTLNFTHPDTNGRDLVGQYLPVQVTRSGPNSLVGEALVG
jgi:tRNA-2-methylthio-N6-dimethylallyladenosine synthase